MRPVINVRVTQTGPNEVFFQANNALHNFGSLTMPLREYREFMASLLTGSRALGKDNRGVEIALSEEAFDQWQMPAVGKEG
jgi:hypothetical protein